MIIIMLLLPRSNGSFALREVNQSVSFAIEEEEEKKWRLDM